MREGCDTKLKNKDGVTGWDLAQHRGHTAVVERLDQLQVVAEERAAAAQRWQEAAHRMARAEAGALEALARLHDEGHDVDVLVEPPKGEPLAMLCYSGVRVTALHVAVLSKQEAAARLLLERGADPSLAGSMGQTPLMVAAYCHSDNLTMVRMLLAP